MKRSAGAELKVDVLVGSDRWEQAGAAKAVVRRALAQAAAALPRKVAEVAILLTDDAVMRTLNRNWRGVDAATNVLAFPTRKFIPTASPASPRSVARDGRKPGSAAHVAHGLGTPLRNHLGDVVLAYETVSREAHRDGRTFDHHLTHLVVHGFLHLLGYDHMNDAQTRRMQTLERAILRDLAVPDPYDVAEPPIRHASRRAAIRPRGPREGQARRADNA